MEGKLSEQNYGKQNYIWPSDFWLVKKASRRSTGIFLRGVAVLGIFLLVACSKGPPPEPSPEPPVEAARGYQPRACGFDLNDNGVVGEAADCNLCDGVTRDPDGDGVEEVQIYVDCQTGTDTNDCGAPGTPCASITHAWGARAVASGGGAGEVVVCFRGTCSEDRIRPQVGGEAGTRLEPANGSADRDWQMPTNPTVLAGWDTDDDGQYPPYDPDETAILDGSDGGSRAFILGQENSHLEMAHFAIHDFGRFTRADDSGWLRFDSKGESLSHLYFHDLELRSINMDRAADREISAIHLTTDTLRLHGLLFSNLLVTDNGGAFSLGAGPSDSPDFGPFRWQNITRSAHSCDFDDCENSANSLVFAYAGFMTGLEILDSTWYANVDHWQPKASGGPSGSAFITAARFTRDWTIRNNQIVDYKNGLIVRGGSASEYSGTPSRPVGGIVFDRNHFANSFADWKYGDMAVDIRGGGDGGEVVGAVTVTNNFLSTTSPWDACIWVRAGNPQVALPGSIVIANNTCFGPVDRYAALVVGNAEGQDLQFLQQNIVFQNNILAGLNDRDLNVHTTYAAENWQADHNVWSPVGLYRWDGELADSFEQWMAASGADQNSKSCEPSFVGAGRHNLHLTAEDTCARDAGLALPEHLQQDIDGDARGQGEAWDIGADEVEVEEVAPDASTE